MRNGIQGVKLHGNGLWLLQKQGGVSGWRTDLEACFACAVPPPSHFKRTIRQCWAKLCKDSVYALKDLLHYRCLWRSESTNWFTNVKYRQGRAFTLTRQFCKADGFKELVAGKWLQPEEADVHKKVNSVVKINKFFKNSKYSLDIWYGTGKQAYTSISALQPIIRPLSLINLINVGLGRTYSYV